MLDATNQALPGALAAGQGGVNLGQGLQQGTSFGQQVLGGSSRSLFGLGQLGSTDQLIGQLGSDLGQQLNESILPGIRSQEIGVGALGGARGEIAQGMATQGAQDAFATSSAQIRQSDLSRRASALQQSGAQGEAFSRMQGLGSELQQDSAQSMMDLGLAPSRAFWGPLQNYASILNGSPSIGNVGQSTSGGRSKSFGMSGGF